MRLLRGGDEAVCQPSAAALGRQPGPAAAGHFVDPLAPAAVRSASRPESPDPFAIGAFPKAYLIWLSGASCEGCTVAATGGTHPGIESLLTGAIPGLPRIELVHSLVSVESGAEWVENLLMAERGDLDAPYIVTCEGSVLDEARAGEGFWSAVGQDPCTGRQVTSREWLDRLAPGAAAVVALGTCASWGGVPAAAGSVTGATGIGDHLGGRFRSAAGVPLVNIPGCAPVGDDYMQTLAALLLFLNGLAPLPELDSMGRPAWLFGETVHAGCGRSRYYQEGVFAEEPGDPGCLVELGCWGPVVQCNISERGVIDGNGGCMQMGGICIGCTMPGFPDRYAPFGDPPPSSVVSRTARAPGALQKRVGALGRSTSDAFAGPRGHVRPRQLPQWSRRFYARRGGSSQ